MGWGKPQTFAVAIVFTPAEVRSRYLPSTSQMLALGSACSVGILRDVNTTDYTEQNSEQEQWSVIDANFRTRFLKITWLFNISLLHPAVLMEL